MASRTASTPDGVRARCCGAPAVILPPAKPIFSHFGFLRNLLSRSCWPALAQGWRRILSRSLKKRLIMNTQALSTDASARPDASSGLAATDTAFPLKAPHNP